MFAGRLKRLKNSAIGLLLIIIISFLGLVIHEVGHALVVVAFGGEVTYFQLFNIQVWPTIKWNRWEGFAGILGYTLNNNIGLMTFMGSGLTAIIGLIAALIIQGIKSRNWLWKISVLTAALFPLDIITYSLFPLFGFRHWIVFGGYGSEPLEGALQMGITQTTYYAGLVIYMIVCYGMVFYSLRRQTLAQPRSNFI